MCNKWADELGWKYLTESQQLFYMATGQCAQAELLSLDSSKSLKFNYFLPGNFQGINHVVVFKSHEKIIAIYALKVFLTGIN